MNLKVKESWKKVFTALKHAGKIVIIATALVAGFASGEIYHRYKDNVKANEMQEPKSEKEISIAINECGEILFIDRVTGQYQIYTDSDGKMFFDIYSSQMMVKQK